MISLQHISKRMGSQTVLHDINLDVNAHEIVVLLGASGSGKTTLLKTINGLIPPSTGNIFIKGQPIQSYNPLTLRHNIGYVFQKTGLFPHLTLEENVGMTLRLQGKSKSIQRERAHEMLTRVNLEPEKFAKRYPHELSGGQQQRVGVARAFASDPDFLLMDEPFAALDADRRNELQDEVLHLNNQFKKTIVFVTHDLFEACKLGDRIAVMHQGRIVQIGSPSKLIHHPKNSAVRALVQAPLARLKTWLKDK